MPKKSKKSKSKRQTLKQKYKVIKKVKELHKKKAKELRQQAKSGRKPKAPKDPGIPSQWPFKQELVKELEWQKQRILATEKQKKAERRAARVRAAASRPPAPPCSHACEGRAAFQPFDWTAPETSRGPPSETLAAEGQAPATQPSAAEAAAAGPYSPVCTQVVEEAAAPGGDEDMAAADGSGGGGLSFEDVQREAAAKQRAYETTTAGPSGRGASGDTAGAARAVAALAAQAARSSDRSGACLLSMRVRAPPSSAAVCACGCTLRCRQYSTVHRPLPSVVRGSGGCRSSRASCRGCASHILGTCERPVGNMRASCWGSASLLLEMCERMRHAPARRARARVQTAPAARSTRTLSRWWRRRT